MTTANKIYLDQRAVEELKQASFQMSDESWEFLCESITLFADTTAIVEDVVECHDLIMDSVRRVHATAFVVETLEEEITEMRPPRNEQEKALFVLGAALGVAMANATLELTYVRAAILAWALKKAGYFWLPVDCVIDAILVGQPVMGHGIEEYMELSFEIVDKSFSELMKSRIGRELNLAMDPFDRSLWAEICLIAQIMTICYPRERCMGVFDRLLAIDTNKASRKL